MSCFDCLDRMGFAPYTKAVRFAGPTELRHETLHVPDPRHGQTGPRVDGCRP